MNRMLEAYFAERLQSLCKTCDGDCCGVVPFSKKEIKEIKKKYRKKLRGLKWEEDEKGMLYSKKAMETGKCPFCNPKENICEIYDLRPQICREYGYGLISCPYLFAGLDAVPSDPEERNRLTKISQKADFERLARKNGFGGVNLIPEEVRNVINEDKFPNLLGDVGRKTFKK